MRFLPVLLLLLLAWACRTTRPTLELAGIHPENPRLEAKMEADTPQVMVIYIKPYANKLEEVLSGSPVLESRHAERIKSGVKGYYEMTDYEPKWLNDRKAKGILKKFVERIEETEKDGLNPLDYDYEYLKYSVDSINTISAERLVATEFRATAAFSRLAHDLYTGRIHPGKSTRQWHHNENFTNPAYALKDVNMGFQLNRTIDGFAPNSDAYKELKAYLAKYRKYSEEQKQIDFITLSSKKLEPGDSSDAVAAIRKRLAITDGAEDESKLDNPNIYDEKLVSAVKNFQHRHGLETDGIIGKGTVAALNKPLSERIDAITLNLERMRWQPRNNPMYTIEVNIPSYTLQLRKRNRLVKEMRIIVGKLENSTPVFMDTLHYVEFSPKWYVPYSIKSEEMLPKLKNNPYHYSSSFKFYLNGQEVADPSSIDWSQYDKSNFPFGVVQQPGSGNALGKVKFIMPNNMNIYLHDTPTDYLFKRSYRAFSHGCIRLSEPAAFAELLLESNDEEWDQAKIYKHMNSEHTRRVYLKELYQVSIAYYTSFVDEMGLLNFRDDVYGHDHAHASALYKATSAKKLAANIDD